LNFINKININSHIMASFDVKNLFTNTPLKKHTVDLIVEKAFLDKNDKFHNLTKFQLKKLLQWTTGPVKEQFSSLMVNFMNSWMGVAKGSPIAPLLADICMNWIFEKASMSGHSSLPTYFIWIHTQLQ